MIKDLDEKTHSLGNFVIICRKCDTLNRGSKTNFFINYKKQYSIFICETCNLMEVFNSKGERVTDKLENKFKKNEEEKTVN